MALGETGDPSSRSLYLYDNRGIEDLSVPARDLYLYENRGVQALDVAQRDLYLYDNRGLPSLAVAARSLYDYLAYTNDEPFPWLEKIIPTEQYPAGEVQLHGDGFGATPGAEGSSVLLGIDTMGVVSWSARSANLWPANSGLASEPAIVVTVPADGESGLVKVRETV